MLDILEFILEIFKLSSLEKTSKTLIQKILKIKVKNNSCHKHFVSAVYNFLFKGK